MRRQRHSDVIGVRGLWRTRTARSKITTRQKRSNYVGPSLNKLLLRADRYGTPLRGGLRQTVVRVQSPERFERFKIYAPQYLQ